MFFTIARTAAVKGCLESYNAIVMCFFFNDTATTEISTLPLHDALPISRCPRSGQWVTRTHSANRSGGTLGRQRCHVSGRRRRPETIESHGVLLDRGATPVSLPNAALRPIRSRVPALGH